MKDKRIDRSIVSMLRSMFGGEGETRTLAPVSRPTPLAGAPRHQLEYFSMATENILLWIISWKQTYNHKRLKWRREWDSNPRYLSVRRFSRPFRYDRFGISPYICIATVRKLCYHTARWFVNCKLPGFYAAAVFRTHTLLHKSGVDKMGHRMLLILKTKRENFL